MSLNAIAVRERLNQASASRARLASRERRLREATAEIRRMCIAGTRQPMTAVEINALAVQRIMRLGR